MGAEANTLVYSPVDGVVVGVKAYRVVGKEIGYELAIAPSNAGGVLVRLTHLDDPPSSIRPPKVGAPVRAGRTVLGRVADFTGVVEQEIARFTNDSGNHVHIEVIRAESGIAP